MLKRIDLHKESTAYTVLFCIKRNGQPPQAARFLYFVRKVFMLILLIIIFKSAFLYLSLTFLQFQYIIKIAINQINEFYNNNKYFLYVR